MKKAIFLSFVLASTLLISCFPSYAVNNNLNDWIYASDGKTIIAYNGKGDDIVIPAGSIVASSVKFVHKGIFSESENDYIPATSLTVESGVTFEGRPFDYCTTLKQIEFNTTSNNDDIFSFIQYDNLEYLKLPEGMKEINESICYQCPKLKTVVLPDGVKTIGKDAFNGCEKLSEINMPDSIEVIGDGAFYKCKSLKEINISGNIKSIGKNAFYYCDNVKTVTIPAGVDVTEIPLGSVVTLNYNGKMTWQLAEALADSPWIKSNYYNRNEFFIIDGHLLKYNGSGKNSKIPSEVKYISPNAFYNSAMENIEIPNGVIEIGNSAFMDCKNLKSVVIPASVERIGEFAFEGCTSLRSLRVAGKTVIGGGAFSYTPLSRDDIYLADGTIYEGAMKDVEYASDPLVYLYPWYDENMAQLQPTTTPQTTTEPKETTNPKETAEPEATPNSIQTPAPAPKELTVKLIGEHLEITSDGIAIEFPDAQPFIDANGRTQIPVRAIMESLDAVVNWNGNEQSVTIIGNGADISLTVGSDIMLVNGTEIKMDTVATIIDERTYVPIRYVAEAMGMTVVWE